MRLGEEAEAAKLLAESFAIDPFNVRVKNMLEVLDLLKALRDDGNRAFRHQVRPRPGRIARPLCRAYLEEEVFPQLTRQLGYAPSKKTLIEIFSRSEKTSGHSWFIARMVGLPFIGTVGRVRGRWCAPTSPTELNEKYDWSLVLRHELVHVLNLQQTDFAVPHWLTEGLAVHLEVSRGPASGTPCSRAGGKKASCLTSIR